MVNGEKIRKRCFELGLPINSLCVPLKIKEGTLQKKLNNKRAMKLEEALIIQEFLSIPDEEFRDYFMVGDAA